MKIFNKKNDIRKPLAGAYVFKDGFQFCTPDEGIHPIELNALKREHGEVLRFTPAWWA